MHVILNIYGVSDNYTKKGDGIMGWGDHIFGQFGIAEKRMDETTEKCYDLLEKKKQKINEGYVENLAEIQKTFETIISLRFDDDSLVQWRNKYKKLYSSNAAVLFVNLIADDLDEKNKVIDFLYKNITKNEKKKYKDIYNRMKNKLKELKIKEKEAKLFAKWALVLVILGILKEK